MFAILGRTGADEYLGDVDMSVESIKKQDKVNYAVSEREDRVTDLTTLTRMTGCTGMYWVATGLQLGFTEL